MAIPSWQQILERGQQTLAVWNTHSPGFTVRGHTWAQHSADVVALSPAAQAAEDAQEMVDDARAARDAVAATVTGLSVRLPRKLDGDLMPTDPYHADLEDIRRISPDSHPNILTRGQRVLALWKKLNARNAAASPVIPPLLVGGVAVAAFQTPLESLPGKQQTVEDKEAILRDRRGDLRTLASKVDQNNKRWYAAWQGEFPAGTPEGDALSQITTEGGGSGGGDPSAPPPPPPPPPPPVPPEMATLAGIAPGDSGEAVLTGLAAAGATSFQVQDQPPGGEFVTVATDLPGPDATIAGLVAGEHLLRVAGANSAGVGPFSDPAAVTVA